MSTRYLVRQFRTVVDSKGRVYQPGEAVDIADPKIAEQESKLYVVEDTPTAATGGDVKPAWGADPEE